MRRWNLLFLMALIAAVLTALSGPSGAMAATTSTFKGKASVYYRNSGPYFVVNFTCTGGKLSGNWTNDTRTISYSGTLGSAGCALSGPPWSSSMDKIPLFYGGNPIGTGATLNLDLSNIGTTKTYVPDTTSCPNTSNPCIEIVTSGLGQLAGSSDFNSNPSPAPNPVPYGTLNLTLP